MLSTVLVQSKRYRVLERQEFGAIKDEIGLSEEGYTEKQTAKKRGKVKGADLLIVAAITGWDPGTSGTSSGLGIGNWKGFGGVLGGVKKSSMAMHIRIIDTETSEVLAATRVEGEATDLNLGGFGGGVIGTVGLAGGLSTYSKTPMEKAIRSVSMRPSSISLKIRPENTSSTDRRALPAVLQHFEGTQQRLGFFEALVILPLGI